MPTENAVLSLVDGSTVAVQAVTWFHRSKENNLQLIRSSLFKW
jgi:hypothetical protein